MFRKINYSSILVSQFVSANRLHDMVQLNASQLTGYQKNEFDTSKFTSGLMLRTHSQYDLPSFGLGMVSNKMSKITIFGSQVFLSKISPIN